jgi:hypothetical protein
MYSKDSWGRLRRKFDRAPTPQEIIDNVICAECAGRINKAQKRKQKPVISFTLLSKILNRARKAKKKLRAQKNKRRRMDKKREVDESKAA